MQLPERKINFTLLEKEYSVEYPKTRGLIEISIQKANLSRNTYDAITSSRTSDDFQSKVTIDAIATLRVLLPDFEKTLNTKSILDLDPVDSWKIVKVYLSTIYPWMTSWQNVLTADTSEEVNDK